MEKPLGIGDQYAEIIVSPDGSCLLEQHGHAHGECRNASRELEARLGKVKNRRDKDDDGGGSYQTTR